MTRLAQPFHFDSRYRTAEAGLAAHVRGLIEAVLFTEPGERVNRPDFGAGAGRLVFEPGSPEVAAAAQFLVQGGLQQFLGGVIEVKNVSVAADGNVLRVQVDYVNLRSGAAESAAFERGSQ